VGHPADSAESSRSQPVMFAEDNHRRRIENERETKCRSDDAENNERQDAISRSRSNDSPCGTHASPDARTQA
jgi:hypothetical protein